MSNNLVVDVFLPIGKLAIVLEVDQSEEKGEFMLHKDVPNYLIKNKMVVRSYWFFSTSGWIGIYEGVFVSTADNKHTVEAPRSYMKNIFDKINSVSYNLGSFISVVNYGSNSTFFEAKPTEKAVGVLNEFLNDRWHIDSNKPISFRDALYSAFSWEVRELSVGNLKFGPSIYGLLSRITGINKDTMIAWCCQESDVVSYDDAQRLELATGLSASHWYEMSFKAQEYKGLQNINSQIELFKLWSVSRVQNV